MEHTNIAQVISNTAETHGSRIGYQMRDSSGAYRKVSYAEHYQQAAAIALFLKNQGVQPQDPVGIYAPNSPEWAAVFAGIMLHNAIAVPIDNNSGAAEIAHIVNDTDMTCIFTTGLLASRLAGLPVRLILLMDGEPAPAEYAEVHTWDEISASAGAAGGSDAAGADSAVIIYTSGTTAAPKGVALTHQGLLSNIYAIIRALRITENDRFLSVIGLSHTFELSCGLILPLCAGATVTYSESLKSTAIFRNMTSSAPTILLAVPLLFRILLEQAVSRVAGIRGVSLGEALPESVSSKDAAEQARLIFGGDLRYCVSGGAPLAAAVAKGYHEVGLPMLQVYGLTEVSGVATLTDPDPSRIGSVGRPLPHVDLKIDDPDGTGKGEVLLRGISVMKEYHNNPQATAGCIADGWFHTGDIGYLDADGSLVICGRSKNVIVTSAGVNVHPEELEERIINSPYIQDVCVIGKQRLDRTETIHAVIVPQAEALQGRGAQTGDTADGLRELIASEVRKFTADLASYKNVHSIQIRHKELPRGRTKKILRDQVKRESFSIQGRLGYLDDRASKPLVLFNGTVVTPFRVAEKHCVVIENGRISQLGSYKNVYLPPEADVIDVEGAIVCPGFIDLHVHGGHGSSFNGGTDEDFDRIIEYYRAHGTTLMLATLYIDERDRYMETIERIAAYCANNRNKGLHGIHLEGPFINPSLKGALNEQYIWRATIENWHLLRTAGNGSIRMVTLAPELPGTDDVMQLAAQDDVVIAIAHSEARYEDIEISIDNGLTQVTHIFNAMHPLHHRKPGILTAALLKRELKVHLIADCIHVHPAVMELLYKVKGPGGMLLITDGVSASGEQDGMYDMGGKAVRLEKGKVYLKDGTLAGSTLTLETAVKNLVNKAKIPFDEAIRMASLNPARVLGLDHKKGVLAVGRDADLVVLNQDYEVKVTVLNGEVVFSRE